MGVTYNLMAETKRTAIIDKDGANKLVNIVESTSTPWVFGIVAVWPDGSSIWWNDKWYFADEAALLAAYPIWQDWWFAVIGSTNTMWVWSSNTWAWENTNWVTPVSPIDPPIDDILLTPPVWPTLWDTYLINWVGTWAWATHDFETTIWDWAAWVFDTYIQGNVISVIGTIDPENAGLWILWATERNQYGQTLDPVTDILLANPASPVLWDRWLINWVGTGLFATHNYEIAEWDWAAWEFTIVNQWDTLQVLWRSPAFTNTWTWVKWVTLWIKQNVVLAVQPNSRPIKWDYSWVRNTTGPSYLTYSPTFWCFMSATNSQSGTMRLRMYPLSTTISNTRYLVGWEAVIHCRASSVVPITVVARNAASVICVIQPWETYRIIAADPANANVAAWRAFEKLDVWLTPDQTASLKTSQLLVYPHFGVSPNFKETLVLWEANFTSKWTIRYDFPIPVMPQVAISWGWFARAFTYNARTNTTTWLPEYSWVISNEINPSAITPPVVFWANSPDGAIVLFEFIMINASWWTLTTGIDWEADWFLAFIQEAPWVNSFMLANPFFYFDGTDIVNKNNFMFANIDYLVWDANLNFDFADNVVIPNWQEYVFYIAYIDELFMVVPQASQAENIVWVIWLNNTTWVDFTIGTDPLSDLAWDITIITYSWDNFIGSWASEAAITAWWGFVSEGYFARIDGELNQYYSGNRTLVSPPTVVTDKITLSSADILNLNSSPISLIPSIAWTYPEIISVTGRMNYGTAAYATNTRLIVTNNWNELFSDTAIATPWILLLSTLSRVVPFLNTQTLTGATINPATDTTLFVVWGNPTAGDGTLDIYITYKRVTL